MTKSASNNLLYGAFSGFVLTVAAALVYLLRPTLGLLTLLVAAVLLAAGGLCVHYLNARGLRLTSLIKPLYIRLGVVAAAAGAFVLVVNGLVSHYESRPGFRYLPSWLYGLDFAGVLVAVGLLSMLGLGVYVLPAIVGWHKRNHIAIAALDLLAGWTLVGWVGALVWALTKDQQEAK